MARFPPAALAHPEAEGLEPVRLARDLDVAIDYLITALHQLAAIDPIAADRALDRLAAKVAAAMGTL
jgi:hypothetical protein